MAPTLRIRASRLTGILTLSTVDLTLWTQDQGFHDISGKLTGRVEELSERGP